MYARTRPYLYELCLLDGLLYISSITATINSLIMSMVGLMSCIITLVRSKRTRRFLRNNHKLILSAILYCIAFAVIHLRYGHGNLIFITTALTLVYVYGFEHPSATSRKKNRSAYSVFNNGFRMLGDLDAGALVAQFTMGLGGAVGGGNDGEGGVGGDGEGEGEGGKENVNEGEEETAIGGVRKRAKKKDKSAARKKELEARKDRQMQRLLARDDELVF
jgi:hypothetical protein